MLVRICHRLSNPKVSPSSKLLRWSPHLTKLSLSEPPNSVRSFPRITLICSHLSYFCILLRPSFSPAVDIFSFCFLLQSTCFYTENTENEIIDIMQHHERRMSPQSGGTIHEYDQLNYSGAPELHEVWEALHGFPEVEIEARRL